MRTHILIIILILNSVLAVEKNDIGLYSPNLMFEEFQISFISGRGYEVGYICWDDLLVVTDNVYKKVNGEYLREEISAKEMLQNWFGFSTYQIEQYKNYLITFDNDRLNFYIYDMESNKLSIYPGANNDTIGFSWQVYNGLIYYMSNKTIYCMDILTGENQSVYKYGMNATQFLIRKDGSMVLEIYESDIREYKLLQFDEQGRLSVNNIFRTDEYRHDWWHEFNEYGLFITGTFFYSQGLILDEAVVLRENGGKEVLPLGIQFISEDGYFMWEDSGNREVLLYYDFEGNMKDTYAIIDENKIGKGYYLEAVIWGDGEIYAFYCNEINGRLWVSRVEGEKQKRVFRIPNLYHNRKRENVCVK